MQKKLIALAIAGLASSAAFADSNVTIYGRMDFGYMGRSGDSGGVQNTRARTEFASGIQSASRLGFKGAEDIGNGLKVIFETEYGIKMDQTDSGTNAVWTNRHSYVGLTGGFGTAVGGRLDGIRYGIFTGFDPFGAGTVGNFTQMTVQYDRADNAIAYISPKWSGFGFVTAYATNTHANEGSLGGAYKSISGAAAAGGNASGNAGDDQLFSIMGTYDNGPIALRLNYETTGTRNIKDDNRLFVADIAGSYDFGVVKVSALYDIIKGDKNSFIGSTGLGLACGQITGITCNTTLANGNKYDRRNWLIGATAPIGKFTAKLSFGKVQNKEFDDADAWKWAIGADYALSKRTNLYMDFASIHNDHHAVYSLTPAPNSNAAGLGVRGMDIGIAHNF